jgi:hypothetical protein
MTLGGIMMIFAVVPRDAYLLQFLARVRGKS